MQWPDLAKIRSNLRLQPGFTWDQLQNQEVKPLVQLLREWYPDIEVGMESVHLDEEFYFDETYLAGGNKDAAILPTVMKFDGNIVGVATFERNSDALTVTARLGAVAPNHRGMGLAHLGPVLITEIGKAMGAELVYYLVTLKIIQQQIAAEKFGFELVGIVPAYDRDMIEPGTVRRVYEALYAKVLVSEEKLFVPQLTSLTPKTQALWNVLFPNKVPQ